MENNSIFFQCQVLNVEDPMMLGRIRGVRLIDNYDDILKSISDPPWNEEKDIWTSRDPFVFNPLLPYFVYSVPKVDELVQVLYTFSTTGVSKKEIVPGSILITVTVTALLGVTQVAELTPVAVYCTTTLKRVVSVRVGNL